MTFTRREIVYFERPGPQNTIDTLNLAKKRADELKVRDVVVASTTGQTGVRATTIFKGFNIVVVSHLTGWKKAGMQELTRESLKRVKKNGGKILTCTHALSGVERAIKNRFGTVYPTEIMAETLKLLGEGTKVAVEIAVMAADAGLIPVDKDVIAIAGSNKGADTALIVQPANSNRFFDLTIKEIIAKPRNRHPHK